MNISFKTTVQFLGRNGVFKCTGINLTKSPLTNPKLEDTPYVTIAPITSRDITGRSMIQIPFENIPELIKALQEIVGDDINNG